MKNIAPLLFIVAFFTASCNDMFEKQLKIYDNAIDDLEDIEDFQTLIHKTLDTETKIATLIAKTKDEEKEELEKEYGDSYKAILDSVSNIREDYYSQVDRLFLEYTFNFVERRTLLYKIAADRYCKTEYIEELDAIKEIIKRYSKLSFVESQRSCDPPESVRKEYETQKELAENCFDVAKKRILEDKDK